MGDLDGDGDLDLAVANGFTFCDNVSILLGAGDGSFAPQQTFPTGSEPLSVAMGDLDGDGDLDLAVANSFSDNVSILLNQSTAPAAGPDLNGDGAVNGGDISVILNSFGAVGESLLPDLNNDGVVNGGDISVVLNAWTG